MRQFRTSLPFVLLLTCQSFKCLSANSVNAGAFTRLEQLPSPRISASTEAYPGGKQDAGNLIDRDLATEYSSNGKGINTIVEFDFGEPKRIAAFRHVDRNDPATVASSELLFFDGKTNLLATVPVTHVNQRAGVTFLVLPSAV